MPSGCYNHGVLKMLIGAVAINKTGSLPEQTLNLCINTDAVLFGAIGMTMIEAR
jgi:3-isopropylmalate dehydrogenase